VAHNIRPRNVHQQRVPATARNPVHRCDGGTCVCGINSAARLPEQMDDAVAVKFHDLRGGLDLEVKAHRLSN
jgi:hypothetical protein